jgi:hypothetical protein
MAVERSVVIASSAGDRIAGAEVAAAVAPDHST